MALGIDPGVLAAYGGAMATGLLHGLEPGHGWPLTVREAANHPRPSRFAITASFVLSAGHFISTLVVVMLFFLVAQLLGLLERPLYLIGGSLLIAVAVYPYIASFFRKRRSAPSIAPSPLTPEPVGELLRSKHDDHYHPQGGHTHSHGVHSRAHFGERMPEGTKNTLRTIFLSALILGFVHEEEFALIGFVAAGANALLIGLLYGLSVTAAIVSVTWVAMNLAKRKGGELDQRRLVLLGHVSGVLMLAIGLYYIARGLGFVV